MNKNENEKPGLKDKVETNEKESKPKEKEEIKDKEEQTKRTVKIQRKIKWK